MLIEVGYAIKSLGFSRVLLVQNTFFGGIEDLPFDLRGKRIITYSSNPESDSRVNERNALSKKLRDALIAILPVLKDMSEEKEELFDIRVIEKQIDDLYKENPDNLETELSTVIDRIEGSEKAHPENKSYLLNRILERWRNNSTISKNFLYQLAERSIKIHPTSSAYFNMGLIAGNMRKPYDSICAYMKAIDLGDPNPSLCFLNAGNRYRELNDIEIALAFYEKAIEMNPKQANAYLAAAQIHEQNKNSKSAQKFYKGFLDWYNDLPERLKVGSLHQQAEQANTYVKNHQNEA